MSLPVLAAQCLRELDHYRRGELCTDAYGLELLHRAIMQSDQEAWVWVQQCFGGMVRGWLRRHPQKEVTCRLQSEENYVTQTFEKPLAEVTRKDKLKSCQPSRKREKTREKME